MGKDQWVGIALILLGVALILSFCALIHKVLFLVVVFILVMIGTLVGGLFLIMAGIDKFNNLW